MSSTISSIIDGNLNISSSTGSSTIRPHYVPHFATIPNESISILTPYSGLMMTLWLVVLYSIKRYILENSFPYFYGEKYLRMDDGLRRGFLVHHVSAGVKILLLIVGAKPFCDVVFGKSTLHDGFSRHSHHHPTMGDILIVLTQLFVSLYIFELLIRKSPSPIAVLHHVGAIIIAQSAVALSLDTNREVNATMEYVLCLVWGAFDVLSELWLNLAFILYRTRPKSHTLLSYVFGSCCIISVMGTVAETIMVMTLFGQSWDKWDLSFKVVTPILHVLFTVAQFHAAKILFVMWSKQKKLGVEQDRRFLDPERGLVDEERSKKEEKAVAATSVADIAETDSQLRHQPSSLGGQSQLGDSEGGISIAPSSSMGPRPSTEEMEKEKEKNGKKKNLIMRGLDKFFTGRS